MYIETIDLEDREGQIVISYNEKESGEYFIYGKVLGTRTEEENSISYRTKKKKYETKSDVVNKVINKIKKKLPGSRRRNRNNDKNSIGRKETEFDKAFDVVKKNSRDYIPSWKAKNTIDKNFSHFKRNFLNEINKNEGLFLSSELEEIAEKLTQKSFKNGNSDRNEENSLDNVAGRFRDYETIYSAMQTVDNTLPDIHFPGFKQRNRSIREQVKTLTREDEVKIRNFIENLISDDRNIEDVKLGRAILLMYDGGLRTGEAAGVIAQNSYFIRDDLCVISINCQIIKNNEWSDRLKTKNSYRKVPISCWASKLFKKACDLIGDEEKKSVPVQTSKLSSTVRTWLISIIEDFEKLAKQDEKEKAVDESKDRYEDTLSAYVLRRARANTLHWDCGVSEDQLDYLLGHERKTELKVRTDYNANSTFLSLAEKLSIHEMFLGYENIPTYYLSENRECAVLKTSHKFCIVNDLPESVCLEQYIEPLEVGNKINILTNGSVLNNEILENISNGSFCRSNTEIIGVEPKEVK